MTAPRTLVPDSPLSLDETTPGEAHLSVDLSGKADASHTHAQSDVTGLSGALASKVDDDDARLSDARTPTAHSHEVGDITATGTASSATYLRGDGAWATPSGGGGGTPDAHAASHGVGGSDPVTVAQSQVTDLASALGGKVDSNDSRLTDARTPTAHAASHGEGGSDPITIAQSQVTDLGTTLSGKVETNDERLSDARTPTAHAASHEEGGDDEIEISQSQVDGLATALSGKVDDNDARLTDARTPTAHAASHGEGQADAITVAQSQVSGLSTTLSGKADATHTHAISDVTNLSTELSGKANSSHTHAISDVTNLGDALAARVTANVHDGEDYPARPTADVVMWIGPDDPDTDAEANDVWLDTSE